jgi:hypothetical protein
MARLYDVCLKGLAELMQVIVAVRPRCHVMIRLALANYRKASAEYYTTHKKD